MPASKSLLSTTDGYTDTNTISYPGTYRLNVHVFNAAIYYQIDTSPLPGGGNWSAEIFRAPGYFGFDRPCQGIRFRSGATGVPAVVNCDLWKKAEL